MNYWKLMGTGVLLACSLLMARMVQAQTAEVSGTVVDAATEAPIPGVNVAVEGTTTGTATDAEGQFAIALGDQRTLVVSFVGYRTQRVEVPEGQTQVDVRLEEDVLGLEEVLVTGLATSVKRSNLANAVGSISTEDVVPAPAQTLERALSGKIAGLTVSQNTGAPGGGINVNLRGTSTITGDTQPLYVVDGVVMDNSAIQSGLDFVTEAATAGSDRPQGQPTNRIADLNPNDIESIEVLKGASASAIYGAKATNGVVIITTKRGRTGSPRLNITQQVGFNTILNKIGSRKFTPETAEALMEGGAELLAQNGNLDYEDLIYGREGFINETAANLSGGSEDTRYYVSGLVQNEDGIVENTGYEKYSGQVSVEQRLFDRLDVRANASLTRSQSDRSITGNENEGGTTLGFAQVFTPAFIDLRPDAEGIYPDGPAGSNPLQTIALLKNRETTNRGILSGRMSADVFQAENQSLELIFQGGADVYSVEHEVVSPPELQFEQRKDPSVRGVSVAGETTSLSTNFSLNAVHRYTTASSISFSSTAGFQYDTRDFNNVQALAEGLVVTQDNIDQASSLRGFQNRLIQRERGLFFQEEVDLFEKVFLTVGLRADASSRVGNTDKFFLYPKASAAVRLSQFDFWAPVEPAISEFKLRAAFGRTGNLPRADAKYTSLVAENVSGLGGVLVPTRLGNPEIEPETTEELEFGFDAAFLNERSTLEVTYYRQNITDLILENELPTSSGFQTQFINAGEMRTTGVEVGLEVIPVATERVNWRSRVNFSRTRSEVTELGIDPFELGGFALSLGQFQIQEGVSPTAIVGLDEEGNKTFFGDANPDFQIGFSNDLTVGPFDLYFLWDWQQGGDVINLGIFLSDLAGTTPDLDTPDGQARVAGVGGTGRFVEDGTYLKLREVSLTYNVPGRMLTQWLDGQVSSLSLGLSGRNLFMLTDYKGYDPEVSQFGNVAIGRAVDVLPFPSSRSFYLKLAVGF